MGSQYKTKLEDVQTTILDADLLSRSYLERKSHRGKRTNVVVECGVKEAESFNEVGYLYLREKTVNPEDQHLRREPYRLYVSFINHVPAKVYDYIELLSNELERENCDFEWSVRPCYVTTSDGALEFTNVVVVYLSNESDPDPSQ